MISRVNERAAKRISFLAFFLMYLWFAIIIWQVSIQATGSEDFSVVFERFNPVVKGLDNTASILLKAVVADVFLAGIVDIAIAFLFGIIIFSPYVLVPTFAESRALLGKLKGPASLFKYLGLPMAMLAGLMSLVYVPFFEKLFVNVGPLFFLLVGLYIVRNPIHILLGKKKEEIVKRFNQTYGPAVIAFFIVGLIFIITAIVIADPKRPGSPTMTELGPFFGLLTINLVTIYYLALSATNLWQALPTKKIPKGQTRRFRNRKVKIDS